MQVVVDALLTTYDRVGVAADSVGNAPRPAVVLLHGWGDNAGSWQQLRDVLADTYDVIALNLPGFGGTDQPPQAWGLTDYAAFVAAFLKKISVTPYAIVAHSNGAAIAVRGLANDVLSAEKLVLLGAAGIRSELQGRKKVLRVIAKTGKVLSSPLPAGVRKHLRRRLYTAAGSDMLVAEHMEATFKKIVTDDIQADAALVQVPTLLIYGEDDLSTPVQYGRILHNLIAGSILETLSGTGHFVHLDQPRRVETMTRKFLA
jgi:pimeloyl-ACP methyl ester carboxylesterase